MSLFEYENRNAPDIRLTGSLRKPTDGTVVGHVGVDVARDGHCAVFPRDREDHYFRKYSGYGLSETIVEDALDANVYAIYVVERDRCNRLLEFEPLDFATGDRIAYSPEEDTIVEDNAAIEANSETFSDVQRVVSEDRARRSWRRSDCTIVRK